MQEIELINAGATRSSKYVSSWIFKAEAGKLAQPVYSTYATQTNWSTTVIEIPDSTVNVGYTDYNAEDMGWAPNLKEGYTFAMGGFTIGQPYSLRASSPQIEGDATFHLTY